MRFSVLIGIYCGFAFLCGFAVSTRCQCPLIFSPRLNYNQYRVGEYLSLVFEQIEQVYT